MCEGLLNGQWQGTIDVARWVQGDLRDLAGDAVAPAARDRRRGGYYARQPAFDRPRQAQRRADERQMREGLREVAQMLAPGPISSA